ncbi:hypothetical protein LJR084_001878 [Variovorax sp. LjRoot84]|uniref:hypothetical protein n=1 Tax=Variovorax sp. LjRoot84 TaxID=3342340 RepID=UPI003ED1244F
MDKFIGHAVLGESTKANAMMPNTCAPLVGGKPAKLLSVKAGKVEFVPVGSTLAEGYWAPSEAFEPTASK